VEARCPPAEKPMMPIREGSRFPALGVGADRPQRPLGVEQRHPRSARRQAVLQHRTGNAVTIKPGGNAVALGADDLDAVNRRPGRLRPPCRWASPDGVRLSHASASSNVPSPVGAPLPPQPDALGLRRPAIFRVCYLYIHHEDTRDGRDEEESHDRSCDCLLVRRRLPGGGLSVSRRTDCTSGTTSSR